MGALLSLWRLVTLGQQVNTVALVKMEQYDQHLNLGGGFLHQRGFHVFMVQGGGRRGGGGRFGRIGRVSESGGITLWA